MRHHVYDEPAPTKTEGPFTELLETFQREDTKAGLATKSRGQVSEEDFYYEKQQVKEKRGKIILT